MLTNILLLYQTVYIKNKIDVRLYDFIKNYVSGNANCDSVDKLKLWLFH